MDNNINFEIFEAPALSKQEIEQKRLEKAAKAAEKSKRNTAIKIFGTLSIVLVAVIAALLIYFFTAPLHNPQRLAAKYIDEINSGEWEKAYSRLYFENSTTIDKEAFINYCNENPQSISFTDGKIIDYAIEKDTESNYIPNCTRIFYSVNYVLEDGNHGTFYLSAEKTNNKSGKLAEYSILPSQKCYASLKITAPEATSVTVNGINLDNPVTENDNIAYEIKYNFDQALNLHFRNPYCNEADETIELKPGINEYNFTPEITEECYNNLCKQAEECIASLYTDIINGSTDFGKYKLLKAYKNSGFNADIEKIKSDVFMGNYSVSDFNIEEALPKKSFADIDKQLSGTGDNEIDIKYDFRYSYTIAYNKDDDNPVTENRAGEGYFSVQYKLCANEWYINNISASAWF